MGLSGLDTWTLAEAWERTKGFRQFKDQGIDPIAAGTRNGPIRPRGRLGRSHSGTPPKVT